MVWGGGGGGGGGRGAGGGDPKISTETIILFMQQKIGHQEGQNFATAKTVYFIIICWKAT